MSDFGGHYNQWRQLRCDAIRDHHGKDWFKGKTILELAAGAGHVSEYFRLLEAVPLCVEGRQDNINMGLTKHPNLKFEMMNLEKDFPVGKFDLTINMGLLYHMFDWEKCLVKTLESSDLCVIETEVVDSDQVYEFEDNEPSGYDQGISKRCKRFSVGSVEHVIKSCGHDFVRLDKGLDSGIHKYDWKILNSQKYRMGQRKFWLTRKTNG